MNPRAPSVLAIQHCSAKRKMESVFRCINPWRAEVPKPHAVVDQARFELASAGKAKGPPPCSLTLLALIHVLAHLEPFFGRGQHVAFARDPHV